MSAQDSMLFTPPAYRKTVDYRRVSHADEFMRSTRACGDAVKTQPPSSTWQSVRTPRSSPYRKRHSKRLAYFAFAVTVGPSLAIPGVVRHKRILPQRSPEAVNCK